MHEWTSWQQFQRWTPLRELPVTATKVSHALYQIAECAFLIAPDHDASLKTSSKGPFVTLLVWAPTTGAVRRVLDLDIAADDGAKARPPSEMLLCETDGTYNSLLAAARKGPRDSWLEHAGYQIAGDGAGRFAVRTLDALRFSFHFRSRHAMKEVPFCIYYRLDEPKAPPN